MSQQTTESSKGETNASVWKTDQRIKIAGLGGIIGGIGLSLLSIGRTGVGIDPGSISIVYPLGYTLLAIALLAGNAHYKRKYGARGNSVALLLALSIVSYAASTVVIVLSLRVFDFPLGPFTSLIGIAFFATRIFGTIYGVVLWRHTDSSRIAAVLFAVILPSMFIIGPLTILGIPAFGLELPLYLALIVFGYELWREI